MAECWGTLSNLTGDRECKRIGSLHWDRNLGPRSGLDRCLTGCPHLNKINSFFKSNYRLFKQVRSAHLRK